MCVQPADLKANPNLIKELEVAYAKGDGLRKAFLHVDIDKCESCCCISGVSKDRWTWLLSNISCICDRSSALLCSALVH